VQKWTKTDSVNKNENVSKNGNETVTEKSKTIIKQNGKAKNGN